MNTSRRVLLISGLLLTGCGSPSGVARVAPDAAPPEGAPGPDGAGPGADADSGGADGGPGAGDGDGPGDGDGDGPGDGDGAGDEPTGDGPPAPVDFPVVSGEYRPAGYTVIDDPCGIMTQLSDLDTWLPTGFDVERYPNGFRIEGTRYGGDYGTEGPVLCLFEGDTFTCETQTVVPVDGFLGQYGWRYAIDYSGTLESYRAIVGTARVDFVSIDPDTQALLDTYDLLLPDCAQTIELRIARIPVE